MRGERALPKFFVHFSQTVNWVNLGIGMGRGRPLPKFFWLIGVKKKWYRLPKLGGGVEVIWKNPKEQLLFFRETFPTAGYVFSNLNSDPPCKNVFSCDGQIPLNYHKKLLVLISDEQLLTDRSWL